MFPKFKKQLLFFFVTVIFLTATNPVFTDFTRANYLYQTEVIDLYQTENSQYQIKDYENFELPKEVSDYAKEINKNIDKSFFLSKKTGTKISRNPSLARQLHIANGGKILNIKTKDNETLECTYFARGNDKLLVVGAGFTNEREVMSPFVALFPDYDILLFDYRGHGYQETSWLTPWQWTYRPTSKIFGVDNTKTKLGNVEEKDVFAVVDYFRTANKYKEVNGLAICYSTLIFAKAQAMRQEEKKQKLFDKLILDGCWLSLDNFTAKIIDDPKILFDPQKGGWSNKWIVKQQWFKTFLLWLGDFLGKKDVENIQITDYMKKIQNTPLLLWYGKNDLTILRDEFEKVLDSINTTPATAIITSNPHVLNHLKQKEFYKFACETFLELKHNDFIGRLDGTKIN